MKTTSFSRSLIIILILGTISYGLHSQINLSRYQRDFYSSGISHRGYKIVNTKDSGTCVYGINIQSSPAYLYTVLTRLDKSGNLIWTKGYVSSPDSVFDVGDIFNTMDDGFIIAGCHTDRYVNFSNYYYPCITRLNSSGNVMWSKTYYPLGNAGMVLSVKEFSDSTIVLTLGYWTGSVWTPVLQKLDKNGNILWSKKLKNWGLITEKQNKNILFGTNGDGTYAGDFVLKEFDKNGNDVWEKKYHNMVTYTGLIEAGTNSKDEIVVYGQLYDSISNSDNGLCIFKTNGRGLINFSKKYGLQGGISLYAGRNGNFAKDCGIFFTGNFWSSPIGNNNGLIKLDGQGNLQWAKIYDRATNNTPTWATVSYEGGYSLLSMQGSTANPFTRIIKVDKNGNTPCNNDTSIVITSTVISLLVDSTLQLSSTITITNSPQSITILSNAINMGIQCSDIISQLPDNCNGITTGMNLIENNTDPHLFPNPGSGIFTLTNNSQEKYSIEIYTYTGQLVLKKEIREIQTTFDLKDFSDGLYFVKILDSNTQKTIPFIKE